MEKEVVNNPRSYARKREIEKNEIRKKEAQAAEESRMDAKIKNLIKQDDEVSSYQSDYLNPNADWAKGLTSDTIAAILKTRRGIIKKHRSQRINRSVGNSREDK